ncbi:MAG: hypothetical protein ACRDUS_20565 [Mycobacterium sp.]
MHPIPTTTSGEVIDHFAISVEARRALDRWQDERPEVAAHVLNHVTRVPYLTESSQLRNTSIRSVHPLGNIAKREVEEVTAIRDWNPRYAMTHVLHYALERFGTPFTYQQFREFCRDDNRARAMLTKPSKEAVKASTERYGEKRASDAIRWRIGNSYYSFMRELVTVVGLREAGIDLQVHPLADALFRTDAWIGNCVVSLYIGNATFRDGRSGRKQRTEDLLGDSFRYVSLNLPTQNSFGSLHVPAPATIRDAAERIRNVTEAA